MYKQVEEKIITPNFEREVKYSCEEVEKALRSTEGSLKHEGIYLTDEERELLQRYANGEITRKEYNEITINKAIESAEGNLKHSGMYVTDEERELVRKELSGEITQDEFLDLVYKLATNNEI